MVTNEAVMTLGELTDVLGTPNANSTYQYLHKHKAELDIPIYYGSPRAGGRVRLFTQDDVDTLLALRRASKRVIGKITLYAITERLRGDQEFRKMVESMFLGGCR